MYVRVRRFNECGPWLGLGRAYMYCTYKMCQNLLCPDTFPRYLQDVP